jgi:hypothetical protein
MASKIKSTNKKKLNERREPSPDDSFGGPPVAPPFPIVEDSDGTRYFKLPEGKPSKRIIDENGITGNPVVDNLTLDELRIRDDLGFDVKTKRAYRARMSFLAGKHDMARTLELISRRNKQQKARVDKRLEASLKTVRFTENKFSTESAVKGEMTEGKASGGDKKENVLDHAEAAQHVTVGKALHDLPDGMNTQFELSKFFERPFSIYDAAWAPATEYNVNLAVWDLWSKNAAVRAKLSNYAFFKGTLHLKISFSGTPFHYGVAMASYQPYPDYNATLVGYDEQLAATAPGANAFPPYKCYLSQARGTAYIDVKDNEPLEMTIPFLSYKESYKLFNQAGTVITNATSFNDFLEAGELRLVTLNQIGVANEDYSSSVSVNVYAWVTDIELGCITATDFDITAEAKRKKRVARAAREIEQKAEEIEDAEEASSSDEEEARYQTWRNTMRDKPAYSGTGSMAGRVFNQMESAIDNGGNEYADPGPVTKVASAIGTIGDTLADVPVIGSFAKATSTIAGKVRKFASFFGFSKPPVLDKVIYVKNTPFNNGATTAGPTAVERLTVDPKQELSIDPSYCGDGGVDSMAIQAISSVESFLTTFPWADTDTALSTVLWASVVSPMLMTGHDGAPVPNTDLTQPTAMAYAVTPFKYWRGTIRYRFNIVCSKFHRGKLIFKYEPNYAARAVITAASAQLNQNNAIILDIQESQEIVIDVDWANERAWLNVDPNITPVGQCNLPDFLPIPPAFTNNLNENVVNGYLEVRVLNELVQPTDLSTVKVNVFVSCPDLMVAVPEDTNIGENRVLLVTESEVINKTNAKTDHICEDHFGEKIVSFRSLMKRYVLEDIQIGTTLPPDDNVHLWKFKGRLYPEIHDSPKTSQTGASTTTNEYNLFQYLRYAYMGMRGGMRYRIFVYHGWGDIGNCDYFNITLAAPSNRASSLTKIAVSATNEYTIKTHASYLNGTAIAHIPSNGGIEFEIPYYSDNLFQFSCDNLEGASVSLEAYEGFNPTYPCSWEVTWTSREDATTKVYVRTDVSTAEDFTFLRFLGAPYFITP